MSLPPIRLKWQNPATRPPLPAVEGADHSQTQEHCRTCGVPICTADFFCSRECWEAEAAYDGFDDLDEDGEVPELDFDE